MIVKRRNIKSDVAWQKTNHLQHKGNQQLYSFVGRKQQDYRRIYNLVNFDLMAMFSSFIIDRINTTSFVLI